MSTAAAWTCPSCERRVPPRVAVCRCGQARPATAAAEPLPVAASPADAAPTSTPRTSPLLVLLPVVVVLAVGGWWWTRPAAQAPVASPAELSTSAGAPVSAPAPAPQVAAPDAPLRAEAAPPEVPSAAPTAAATPAAGALEDIVSRAIGGVVMVEAAGSRGTGFFVTPDLVITNEHVVGRDTSVTIRLHDGATRMARVERTAADLDLALLRTAAVPASAVLTLGRADTARVGQEVIAIGSALGLQSTVTRGILSAKRQSGAVTLLQTDAAINPGNSGGPLLDRDGRVLGVTTLKVGGSAEGLGFAVSADHLRPFIEGRAAPAAAASAVAPAPSAAMPALGGGLDTSAEGQRATGTAAFQNHLQQLAQHAAQIDAQWARVESTCRPDLAREGDRAWFALATRTARLGGTDPNCPYWLADLEAASRTFGEAMRAAAEQARRAGVYPGDQRALRRQWRLDWSGFDR